VSVGDANPKYQMAFNNQVRFRSLSLQLQGRNLATWTSYSGSDPEGPEHHRVPRHA